MVVETELMTIDEAARYLKVCRKTLYRWLKAGKLKAYRVGRQWRLRRADLDQWLEENRAGEQPSTEAGFSEAAEKAAVSRVEHRGEAGAETRALSAALELLEEIRDLVGRADERTFSAAEVVAMIEQAQRRMMEASR